MNVDYLQVDLKARRMVAPLLGKLLGVHRRYANGLMEDLWEAALFLTPPGEPPTGIFLGPNAEAQLAAAMDYDGDMDVFVSAGLLERLEDGIEVKDLDRYMPLFAYREKKAAIGRESRAAARTEKAAARARALAAARESARIRAENKEKKRSRNVPGTRRERSGNVPQRREKKDERINPSPSASAAGAVRSIGRKELFPDLDAKKPAPSGSLQVRAKAARSVRLAVEKKQGDEKTARRTLGDLSVTPFGEFLLHALGKSGDDWTDEYRVLSGRWLGELEKRGIEPERLKAAFDDYLATFPFKPGARPTLALFFSSEQIWLDRVINGPTPCSDPAEWGLRHARRA